MHLSTILLSAAPAVTYANVLVPWSFPSASAHDGLKDISFGFNLQNAPHTSGFYFAMQYSWVGVSDAGYTGLQPRPDNNNGPVIHAVFSSFVAGTTTSSPTCHAGADGGAGVSCAVEFNGQYDHTYNCVVESTGDGRTFRGTAVDTVTGESHVIGEYTLPQVVKGLATSENGFVEYYKFNSNPNHSCTSLPKTEIQFFAPTTRSGANGVISNVHEYGDCGGQSNYQLQNLSNGVDVTVGF